MSSFAGVHHVDLVVSSIERSLPFYRDLLAPLGYHRITEVEGERGETIWYLGGRTSRWACGRRRRAASTTATASASTTSLSRRGRGGSSTSAPPGSPPAAPRSRVLHRNTGTCPATTRFSSTTPTASSSKSSTCRPWPPERSPRWKKVPPSTCPRPRLDRRRATAR